jgi:hypothetical protein
MRKAAQWRFERSGKHSWYWERVEEGDSVTRVGPFPSFTACLMDAQQKGFHAGRAERRRIPRDPLPPLFGH